MLFICVVMSNLYWRTDLGMTELLAASPDAVFGAGEYWRLFTSSLIHADLAHLLSNSLMLSLMGYFVTHHFGVVSYPILGFVGGILINLIVIWDYSGGSTLVGASGVVHYLWGFWFVLYLFIQRHVPFSRRLMKVTAVGLFVLVPTEFKPQVSYYAHGVGLAIGMLTGLGYWFLNQKRIRAYEVWEDYIEVVDPELAEEAESAFDPGVNTSR